MTVYPFSLVLTVQEKDVNARQHVSYDKYFVYFQDVRIAYLANLGHHLDGVTRIGLIAADAHCTYKKELRLGDVITAQCRIRDIQKKSFSMEFLIVREDWICADGSATFLCFDYDQRKVIPFPNPLVEDIKRYESIG